MEQRLHGLLAELGYPPCIELRALYGHASYRRYYRARLADGTTCIVMVLPPGKATLAEEITNLAVPITELPYINVGRALAAIDLPVPRLLHYSEPDQWLLIEDFGDTLLLDVVTGAPPDVQHEWYRKTIDLLVELQTKTIRLRPEECLALQRSFDATLLNWEFDHFREYALAARRSEPLPETFPASFARLTRAITDRILDMPYCFTHRDFQSRNVMVRNGALAMLDFQDALRGPYIYDLVALLRDSYIELAPALVEELIAYYAAKCDRDPAATRRDFHCVTAQRKMKDAGRFVYIDRVKMNPDFLQFIPASFRYIRAALAHVPEGKALEALCAPYVPEWVNNSA